jgi:hypothetical protein
MKRPERLLWLDLARVLCAIMILGVHWLHAAFNVGIPIDIIIHYQYQNGGSREFLNSLLIAGTAPHLTTWLTNVIGFFGSFGWEAVSPLIIISGFSLAIAQRANSLTPREWLTWYGKRARRILIPFYLIALPILAAVALAIVVLPHVHGQAASVFETKLLSQFHTPPLGVVLSHIILLDPWGFQWSADFFAPAWWFVPAILLAYAAYPFIRTAARFAHGIPLLAGAALVTMAAYAASAALLIANETWYYIVLQELFNFCLGVVIAQVWLGSARASLARVFDDPRALAIAIVLFAAGNVANDITAFRPIASMLYGPSLALIVVFVAQRIAGWRVARTLTGLDPYDLYLVHQPFAFPVAVAAKVLFHGYAVFVGWFVFFGVAALATRALGAVQRVQHTSAGEMLTAVRMRAISEQ